MGEQDARPWLRLGQWIEWGLLKFLSPVARNVLTVLVKHTNRHGVAWPSGETIARQAGVWRAKVYPALKEIVRLGLYKQEGRVGWKHAGGVAQYCYCMQDLDVTAFEKIGKTHAPWTTGHKPPPPESRGRKKGRRDVSKAGTPGPSPGDSKTGTPETVRDVPKVELRDVPKMEVSGVPKMGTQRGKGKRVLRGNTITSGSLSRSKTGSEEKKTEILREHLDKFFEAECKNGRELKPVSFWLRWLPKYFPPELIEAAHKKAQERES